MSAADAKDLELHGVPLRVHEEVIPWSVRGVLELHFVGLLFLELGFLELGFLELPFLLPGDAAMPHDPMGTSVIRAAARRNVMQDLFSDVLDLGSHRGVGDKTLQVRFRLF
jgi:hypothetical protein